MTITTTHNGISVGASSAEGQNPVKTTLQTGTTSILVSAELTSGAQPAFTPDGVKVFFASCPFDITAAQAVTRLARSAEVLNCQNNPVPNQAFISTSELSLNQGGFLYTWLEWGKQPSTGTLTVRVVELP